LPSESVQMCVTSPPYYGLRNYGMDQQIGLEATPESYVAALTSVFSEVRRVLKADGICMVVIADSFSGSGKGRNANGVWNPGKGGSKQSTNAGAIAGKVLTKDVGGCKPKDLIGIPWMLAFAMRADGWYWRQVNIWHKDNAMPEPPTDRTTCSHEYVLHFSKSRAAFFDNEAIKEKSVSTHGSGNGFAREERLSWGSRGNEEQWQMTDKRLRRSVWSINTKPIPDSHFATYPEELCGIPILAGSREGDTVLDPFMGSGTTAIVAKKYNRNYIGCELNPAYVEIAQKRIGGITDSLFSQAA
jgi:DNA modification methylase